MYNGNQNLKSIGEVYEWGEHEISEYVKCQQDPIYFVENYCKVVTLDHGLQPFKLYDIQKQFIQTIIDNRKVVAMMPRQCGKSTTSAAAFLWFTLFNENYVVAILANKGAAAREVLNRFQIMYENLPLWMQQGIRTWNKGDIELENGSKIFTAATSASGIRGKTCVAGDTIVSIENLGDITIEELAQLPWNPTRKVLTQKGYRKFIGVINKGYVDSLLDVHFTNGRNIRVTQDHKFFTPSGESIKASNLFEGCELHGAIVSHIDECAGGVVYDLECVEETNAYLTNGVLSSNCNLLYVDEASLIPNNVAEQFFASVYPVISSGTSSKILLTSTPTGLNHFWKLWKESEPDNETKLSRNGFVQFLAHYWDIPGRDEAWAEEQKKTLGELKFNQEVLCDFIGAGKTLISGHILSKLAILNPIFHDEEHRLKVYFEPEKDHTYVGVVDTSRGVGGDFSVVCIFDVTDTPYKLVARYRDNKIAPMLLPNVIQHLCQKYNEAFVLVETNDIGGEVADLLFHEQEYENLFSTVSADKKTFITPGFGGGGRLGVMTTKSVKRLGCFTLKNLVEEEKLLINDDEAIFELSTFVEKAGSFQADEGYHDDMAMTLVLFGWLTRDGFFKDLTNVDIRKKLYEKQMENIDADLTPFGFIDDGIQRPESEVHNGCLWVSTQGGELPWKAEVDEFRTGSFTDDHDVPWPF